MDLQFSPQQPILQMNYHCVIWGFWLRPPTSQRRSQEIQRPVVTGDDGTPLLEMTPESFKHVTLEGQDADKGVSRVQSKSIESILRTAWRLRNPR